jgi:hypothetical protein
MSDSPTAPQNAPEPKGEPKTPEPKVSEENQKELLETLTKLEIKTPERIQGLAEAGQQVGQLTDLLNQARNEITRLQMVNNQMQNQPPAPQPQNSPEPQHHVPPTPSDNLESRMWNVLNQFMGHYNEQQASQAIRANAEYEALSAHPDFSVIKQVFDKHISTPAVQRKLLGGQTTLEFEYANVRGDFMKNLALRTKDVITGQGPGPKSPPHIEGPGSPTTPSPASVPTDSAAERAKRLADLKAGTKGSDNDIEALMKELLPDQDPFLVPKYQGPGGGRPA